jgi:hypothetical protein
MLKSVARIIVISLVTLLLYQQPALADNKLVINKGTNQLAFYKDSYLLRIFPVATGRLPEFTPEGTWQVVVKLVNPSWRHPDGGPVIPGGIPENPLGPRWLGFNALNTAGYTYGIHGTNAPESIGTYASLGCIRMNNEDILWLYDQVPIGSEVNIINSNADLNSQAFNSVQINGKELAFASHLGPVWHDNNTWLPIRPVAEAIGYRLSWNNADQSLYLANIDREVSFAIGSQLVSVNNLQYSAEDAPYLLEELTFVPAYYFTRYLGAEMLKDTEKGILSLKYPEDTWNGRLTRYQTTVRVDGNTLRLPQSEVTLSDGENLLIPAIPLFMAAGATVEWNALTNTMEITLQDKHIILDKDNAQVLINGLPAAESDLKVVKGTSYLNLSALTELFGFTVQANGSDRTVDITTKAAEKPVPREQEEGRDKGLEKVNTESLPVPLPAQPETMETMGYTRTHKS